MRYPAPSAVTAKARASGRIYQTSRKVWMLPRLRLGVSLRGPRRGIGFAPEKQCDMLAADIISENLDDPQRAYGLGALYVDYLGYAPDHVFREGLR